jgi:hypothetical protein
MLSHIALVWLGRCHASPDRVSKGAPSDRHARGVVTGGLWMCSQRFLAVLGAPLAGVGGVDGDHADLGLGRHREQSGTEFGSAEIAAARRDAIDDLRWRMIDEIPDAIMQVDL